MTELLERAIAQLQRLPEGDQNAIATMILAEMEEDQRWDIAFARSPDLLASLAATAMKEYEAGETELTTTSCWVREVCFSDQNKAL